MAAGIPVVDGAPRTSVSCRPRHPGRAGLEAGVAESAVAAAWEVLQAEQDLISDPGVAHMGGFEFDATPGRPRAAPRPGDLSYLGAGRARRAARNSGAAAYLTKPVRADRSRALLVERLGEPGASPRLGSEAGAHIGRGHERPAVPEFDRVAPAREQFHRAPAIGDDRKRRLVEARGAPPQLDRLLPLHEHAHALAAVRFEPCARRKQKARPRHFSRFVCHCASSRGRPGIGAQSCAAAAGARRTRPSASALRASIGAACYPIRRPAVSAAGQALANLAALD